MTLQVSLSKNKAGHLALTLMPKLQEGLKPTLFAKLLEFDKQGKLL
jgi:hypothetical protein